MDTVLDREQSIAVQPRRSLARALTTLDLRDPGTITTIVMGVIAVGYLIWQRAGWGGESHRTLISDAIFLPFSLVGAILAWRTSRSDRLEARARQAWLILASAFFCYWIGDTLWFFFENFRSEPPFPSAADAGYLAFYPLLLIGLLRFPVGARGRTDRMKFWLDAGTVLLSGWMVVWFFVLGPTALAASDSVWAKAISIAYPIGDLVLMFGLAAMILRGPAESSRRALGILAVGLTLFVIADIQFGYSSLQEGYQGGNWPDSFWMVAQFLMIVAAQYQYARVHRTVDAEPRRVLPSGKVSVIPYVAVIGAFGLLLIVARRQSPYPLGGMIVAAVGITALVLARQSSVMRENLRLMQTMQRMATTDHLTGLKNRGHFFDSAELLYEQATRFGSPLVAMMFDIDHFKHVNDRFGHAGGDAVLHAVASTFERRLRGLDIVGRYGGDEFVALLPDITLEDATTVAERLNVAVRGTPVLVGDDLIPVSLSIGIAAVEGTSSLNDLLHRADLALYEAKAAGRACVRVLGAGPASPTA